MILRRISKFTYFTSMSLALTTTHLTIQTSQGESTIPQTTDLTFNGRESKIIVTDYVFGASAATILCSTAEIKDTEYILSFTFLPAKQAKGVFIRQRTRIRLVGWIRRIVDLFEWTLMLNYTLEGSPFVSIQINGKPITVILMDKGVANEWHATVISAEGTFGSYFSVGTNETVL
ncbi:hypothetical protein K435DRAFT_906799, partial [Dendrothele bispora CBS 962.96]